jgi:hypothetical protein
VGACLRGDQAKALKHAERGLAASVGPDDPGRKLPFHALGDVSGYSGRLDEAFAAYEEMTRFGEGRGRPPRRCIRPRWRNAASLSRTPSSAFG